MRRVFYFIFPSLLIFFILDRLIKNILFIKGNFLFLKFTFNPYFFFFLQNKILFFPLMIIFFLLFFFLVKSYQNKEFFNFLFLSLIIIGGISNLLDRIFYGFVIDYFNFFSLFTFNLSDIMIFLGVIILVTKLLTRQLNQ